MYEDGYQHLTNIDISFTVIKQMQEMYKEKIPNLAFKQMDVRSLQYDHEERLLELGIEKAKMELAELELFAKAAQSEEDNISSRWNADMSSDSWLSKNIRPMSLIAIFTGYFVFAMMSAYGYNANESYVTLLGNWGMLIMGAYFGGRTVEKLADLRSKK